jgi:hypothetical protein
MVVTVAAETRSGMEETRDAFHRGTVTGHSGCTEIVCSAAQRWLPALGSSRRETEKPSLTREALDWCLQAETAVDVAGSPALPYVNAEHCVGCLELTSGAEWALLARGAPTAQAALCKVRARSVCVQCYVGCQTVCGWC